MNILYISHESTLGGATRSLLGIIDELQDKVNVFVLISSKSGELVNELKKRNVKVISVKYCWWMGLKSNSLINKYIKYTLQYLITYINALRISFVIKDMKIDIIHSNSSVVNMGALISKFSGIPHVWHVREFGEEDHNLFFKYNKTNCFKFMNKYSCKVITISKAVYEKYKNYIDKNKLCIIYNGISKEYMQKKLCVENNKVNILISGSLAQGKGQKEAILAIKKLRHEGFKNMKLNIAGRGKEEYINELKKIVQKYGLQDYVDFLGYIDDMKELRQKIDIELVCSRKEAFGRVTIEAMMSMMPVIGANTGGTKELINNGVNGLLYEQGNYNDLADKIKYLLQNRNKIKEIGINAYNFAKENFTSDKNAEAIYNLYNDILKDK